MLNITTGTLSYIFKLIKNAISEKQEVITFAGFVNTYEGGGDIKMESPTTDYDVVWDNAYGEFLARTIDNNGTPTYYATWDTINQYMVNEKTIFGKLYIDLKNDETYYGTGDMSLYMCGATTSKVDKEQVKINGKYIEHHLENILTTPPNPNIQMVVRKAIPLKPLKGQYYYFDNGVRFSIPRKKIMAGLTLTVPNNGSKYYTYDRNSLKNYISAGTEINKTNYDSLFPYSQVLIMECNFCAIVKVTEDERDIDAGTLYHFSTCKIMTYGDDQLQGLNFDTKKKWVKIVNGKLAYEIPTPILKSGDVVDNLKNIQIFRCVVSRCKLFGDAKPAKGRILNSKNFVCYDGGGYVRRKRYCRVHGNAYPYKCYITHVLYKRTQHRSPIYSQKMMYDVIYQNDKNIIKKSFNSRR